MGEKTFRAILFFVLTSIFCATAILVLLSLANIISIKPEYMQPMFSLLIVECVGSVFVLWRRLTNNPFEEPPDVSGEWEYECIRDDGTYKHGGISTITIKKAPYGWEFSISGKRTWKADKVDGKWRKEVLEAPASWENTWGTFTGQNDLRYAYSIKVGAVLVQGYGWASIKKDQNGKRIMMEGNFFQLPPHDPFYGFQRYTRVG